MDMARLAIGPHQRGRRVGRRDQARAHAGPRHGDLAGDEDHGPGDDPGAVPDLQRHPHAGGQARRQCQLSPDGGAQRRADRRGDPLRIVWATITQGAATPFDERLWPMISRYMGPHYGYDVSLPGAGAYTLSLLVSPPVSARHVEYQDVWLKPHRVSFTFHWAGGVTVPRCYQEAPHADPAPPPARRRSRAARVPRPAPGSPAHWAPLTRRVGRPEAGRPARRPSRAAARLERVAGARPARQPGRATVQPPAVLGRQRRSRAAAGCWRPRCEPWSAAGSGRRPGCCSPLDGGPPTSRTAARPPHRSRPRPPCRTSSCPRSTTTTCACTWPATTRYGWPPSRRRSCGAPPCPAPAGRCTSPAPWPGARPGPGSPAPACPPRARTPAASPLGGPSRRARRCSWGSSRGCAATRPARTT